MGFFFFEYPLLSISEHFSPSRPASLPHRYRSTIGKVKMSLLGGWGAIEKFVSVHIYSSCLTVVIKQIPGAAGHRYCANIF
jgi:hypothetical protein